jgi:hypothetical protein
MRDGCDQPGEFRAPAPGGRRPGFDGPGDWAWYCLDHVRAFNSGYNYFDGMSPDEIEQQQTPYAGWERETRAFSAGAGGTPRWADFVDPLDAIGAKFARSVDRERKDGKPLSDGDRRALDVLGLGHDADRRALRTRYAELVRRFHPDKNGGDRSHEKALQGKPPMYILACAGKQAHVVKAGRVAARCLWYSRAVCDMRNGVGQGL